MKRQDTIYIDGQWSAPAGSEWQQVIDPATEEPFAEVARGNEQDARRAIAAAREAFSSFSCMPTLQRIALIDRIVAAYERRVDDFADIIARETGIPVSSRAQVLGPIEHMKIARDLVATYPFDARIGETIVRREPIGVCALITPWNWPIQTPVIKLIYALAAGCTTVLKPSDASPLSAIMLAEVLHDAKVPAGVFNLVAGRGSIVGEELATNPDVDMVSFTGSTSAGAHVGEGASRSIKRLCLELGGKSANIVLEDADIERAARWTIQRCFFNTGQSCHAPSRLLVPESHLPAIERYLAEEATSFHLGDPRVPTTTLGPAAGKKQFETVQHYIHTAMAEGARLICGGPGRPDGMERGYFVRPTVFSDVQPDHTIAREEIFGPVLAVIPYRSEADAIQIANDSIFGLGGYVFSSSQDRAFSVAKAIRAGRICFNGAPTNSVTPMGGYRQSGIGRSMGVFGLEEYLEVKSIYGFAEIAANLPELWRAG
jgi:aldehyde dehydrogenase (NAD+)